jgi:hypothetical protein
MNFKLLLTFTTLLMLFGCAQKESKTSLKVSFGAGSADFPGGIFVMGRHRRTGAKFSKQLGGSELQLQLINGTWDFISVGWDGGNNFEGDARCGEINGVNLQGADVQVSMTLAGATCAGAKFGNANTINGGTLDPLTVKIHSCAIFDRRKTYAPSDADLISLCDEVNGNHKSYKIVWWEFPESLNPAGVKINPMKSVCINAPTGVIDMAKKIPMLNGDFGMPVSIEAFKATSCNDPNPDIIHFPNGFLSPGQNPNISHVKADGSYVHALIADNICTGDALTDTINFGNGFTISGGSNPTAADTVVICNGEQLKGVGTGSNDTVGASYILGHDIDMTSVTGVSIDNFTGSFDGLDFKIQNFDLNSTLASYSGLFNSVKSAKIRNIDIVGWNHTLSNNVSSPTANFAGLLIGKVIGKTLSTDPNTIVENIYIDNTSSLTYDQQNTGDFAAGALIGGIALPSTINERVEIRNILSKANMTYDFASNSGGTSNAEDMLGGAIGSTAIETGSPGLIVLENVDVQANITGVRTVGGLIATAHTTEVNADSSYTGTITAAVRVGGLIGVAEASTIANSRATLTITPVDSTAAPHAAISVPVNHGGIVGFSNTGKVTVNGTITNLQIDSSIEVNQVGGIAGFMNNTAGENYILNSRAEIDIALDGHSHGGIVGRFSDASIIGTIANIQYNSAIGTLTTKSLSPSNTEKGGLAGWLGGQARMNIVDVFVKGYSSIGGVVGKLEGRIFEIHQKSDVKIQTAGANFFGATVVGKVNDVDDIVIENIISEGDLLAGPTDCNSGGTQTCGMVVGGFFDDNGWTTSPLIANVLIKGTARNQSTEAAHTSNLLVNTFGDTHTVISPANVEEVEASFNIISLPFTTVSGVKTLTFKAKWDDWGLETRTLFGNSESVYKTGSFANHNEAFYIADVDDWNAIGNDAFLMSKSYVLLNDLDFTSESFTPIGGGTGEPFSGILSANGKKLIGISITATSSFDGIFRKVGYDPRVRAIIGFPDDPLKIKNFSINAGSNNISNIAIIGNAIGANVTIHAKGEVVSSAGSGNYYAGIIGKGANLHVENCYFAGKVDTPTKAAVGGIIGSLYQGANDVTVIKNNKVKTYNIKGDRLVGGIVGQSYNSATGATSVYTNNLVEIVQFPITEAIGGIEAVGTDAPGATNDVAYAGGIAGAIYQVAAAEVTMQNNIVLNVDGIVGRVNSGATAVTNQDETPITPSFSIGGGNPTDVGTLALGTKSFSDNFYINTTGADSSFGNGIEEDSDLSTLTGPFLSHPWKLDTVNGTIKLYWEQ